MFISYKGNDAEKRVKKCEKNNISARSLFDVRPSQWGLRGDPYFWEYLKEKFTPYDISELDEKKIKDKIVKEHLQLTGVDMTDKSMVYCERFNHGGMSGGGISGKFWLQTGIPLLQKRWRECIKLNYE